MTTMKIKDLQKLSDEEIEKKLQELKMELVKSKINASKKGTSRAKEIKKIIARILTLNSSKPTEASSKKELKKSLNRRPKTPDGNMSKVRLA